MANPYQPIGPVTNPDLFVGRQRHILEVIKSAHHSAPISMNLVGPDRYGKTSLLTNFEALAKRYFPEDDLSGIRVIYLNLQEPHLCTPLGLISTLCQQIDPSSGDKLESTEAQFYELYRGLVSITEKSRSRILVMIDEMEVALTNPSDFPRGFWNLLRAIIHRREANVAFVLASQLPMADYWELLEHLKNTRGSPLYNVLMVLRLEDFDEQEIEELFGLSDIEFSGEERGWILQFGDGNPHKLQVACYTMYELKSRTRTLIAKADFDKEISQSSYTMYDLKARTRTLIAKADFDKEISQASEMFQVTSAQKKTSRFRTIVYVLMIAMIAILTILLAPLVGQVVRMTGGTLDNIANMLVGLVLMLLIALVLLGRLSVERIREYAEHILGLEKTQKK